MHKFLRSSVFTFTMLTLLFIAESAHAQNRVTIPDAAFVSWLQANGYSGCLNGNQLDTTCAAVLNATTLEPFAVPIRDLTGVQYFKNITFLDCSNDSLTFIPSFPAALNNINCQYNQLTTLPALPASLSRLECADNKLTALPSLPTGITFLSCSRNRLTSLPSLPPGLRTLYAGSNQITTIPALPSTLTNLDFQSNLVSVVPTLPSGLIYFYCNNNNISTLPTLPSTLQELFCSNNQLTSLPVLPAGLRRLGCGSNSLGSLPTPLPAGLTSLECYYAQLTSLPPLPATLIGLYCGYNNLGTLPTLPPLLQGLQCMHAQLTSLPALPSRLINLGCQSNQLTSIPALPDTMTYLYCDSNPNLFCLPELKTMSFLTFRGTGITCMPNYGNVYSGVTRNYPLCGVFNPNGCSAYWNLSGQTYYDADADCSPDVNETGTAFTKLQLYSGGNLQQQIYADAHGYYSFKAGVGTYDITVDTTNLPFVLLCPASGSLTDTITLTDSLKYSRHFAFKCRSTGFDLAAISALHTDGVPRPAGIFDLYATAGDIAQQYGAQCATGVSGQVQITFSGPITYVGPIAGNLTPTSVSGNTLSWTIADFGTLDNARAFNSNFQVNANAVAGTNICFTVTVSSGAGDYDLSNNTFSYCFPVVNALDPNTKEVYPTRINYQGEWLTYTIHFQNVGTAPALHVLIEDTLSNSLDLSTFQLLTYSHKNITQLFGNAVHFSFPNINLVDSATNDSASKGYIQFKIKTKNNLTPGGFIYNTAFIYFDLNEAVVTNTAVDTISNTVGITEAAPATHVGVKVYPNPFNTITRFEIEGTAKYDFELYDVTGRVLYFTKDITATGFQLNRNNLPAGVYFARILGADKIATTVKLVVADN